MLESNYMPHRGEIEVRERFATDYRNGESHLDRVSVVVKLRVSHEQAVKLQRKYPGARSNFILDSYGECADLEITLRTDDATIEPYLRWRDSILAEVYEATQ
jgi:hypothetical protein